MADSATDAATVYFIRPMPIRTRGIADTNVNIELNDKLVAQLAAGEYIAVKLKPGKININLRSKTFLTSKPMPIDVHRYGEFIFDAGQTYFIQTRFTQEEFRGIYFEPKEITLAEAKGFLKRLKPHGPIASAKPLEKL